MAVNLPTTKNLIGIPGIEIGVAAAGIKYKDRPDVAVFVLTDGAVAGGVFTHNSYRAAPVEVAADRLKNGSVRGLVINSGNANAATGERGLGDTKATCRELAELIGCDENDILPFSTGVIGEFLPIESFKNGIRSAYLERMQEGWNDAAQAILTTDTKSKGVSRSFRLDDSVIKATGIVKGSGMIHPNMATMLAFIGTDAAIVPGVLQRLTVDLSNMSFNRLTVDGDTSTNDSFVVVATGKAKNRLITDVSSPAYSALKEQLAAIARELAVRTVRDAEGATKFITLNVRKGATSEECLRVAYSIAQSPLVKTALFAGDPNWGRFCMAIGNAGITDLDPYAIDLYLDDVCVARNGMVDADYLETAAAEVMQKEDYKVTICLGRGMEEETIWTSDLSYEYVRINSEYRS